MTLRHQALLPTLAVAVLAGCGASHSTPKRSSTDTASSSASVSSPPASTSTPNPAPVKPSTTPSPAPLAGKVVAIDPGHNGGNATHLDAINQLVPAGGFSKACDTTGTAAVSGYTEAAFNFDVALRLARILRREGARTVLTRTNNTGVGPCVNQRAAIGNRAHADVAISIHGDGFAPYGHGFDVIEPQLIAGYTDQIVRPSARFAQILRDEMVSSSGMTVSTYAGHDGIDTRGDLGGLNLSTVPKVLLEAGNMQNPHDSALEMSPAWRERLAHVIADAMTRFLRLAAP